MYQLRRILVPTDFSRHAAAAFDHAVTLAIRYGAEITLMHVDEFVVSPLGAFGLKEDFLDTYQKKKMEWLDEQMAAWQQRVPPGAVRMRSQVIPGRAYKVIVEEAEKHEYDLVVIATRGLTDLSSHLIGGTAERVVRFARQPVLSIRGPMTQGGKINSILCPTDLSPAGNIALSYALSIAVQNKASLYIQYISELERPEPEDEIRKRLPDLREHHARAHEVKVEYVFDRDVEPSNSIIRFADDREVSMIVMSTHGKKGLRRVYIGNNTAEVVRQSIRPVLTMTHPLHKAVFSRPLTEKAQEPLFTALGEQKSGKG
jgi:nucleotide-binding universal stress UspA family protein